MISKKIIWEIFRFGVVGALAAATHFIIAASLLKFGVHPLFANGIAYSIAVFVSYFGHKNFTFRQSKGHLGKFIIVSLSGFAFSQFGLYSLYTFFNFSPIIAVAVVVLVVPVLTFLFSKFWVFRWQKK